MPCFVAQSFVLASKKPSLVQLPCAKTREFGEAEFSDCLPVSDSVCVFAFDTGGLGLWLGAFGKSGLLMCQSVPGPPMPVFCDTEFCFCNTELWGPKPVIPTNAFAAFATLVCQRNCVFLCKGTKAKEFGEAEFWDLVLAFGKARQTLLFAK